MSVLSIPKSKDVSESAGSVMLCFTPSLPIGTKSDGSNYTLNYRSESDTAIGQYLCCNDHMMSHDITLCLFHFDCFVNAAGRDFDPVSERVGILPLSTSPQCISITILSNNMVEGQRNFFVSWSLESGILPGVTLDNDMTNVTINDDDCKSLLLRCYLIIKFYSHTFAIISSPFDYYPTPVNSNYLRIPLNCDSGYNCGCGFGLSSFFHCITCCYSLC